MKVLVVPEDFTKDQHILKPIIQAMLAHLGKPKARVRVCQEPRLRGVWQAIKWENIKRILNKYREMDLVLLCVDRDGNDGRRQALDGLEEKAKDVLKPSRAFIAECARQELEVWVLAGHDLPTEWSWSDIRGEPNSKEKYFLPFADRQGVRSRLSDGRKQLAQEAVKRYTRIRQLCPEDVQALENRIRDWVSRQ